MARSKRIWLTVRDDSTLDKATVERCDSYARSRLKREKIEYNGGIGLKVDV